MAINSINAQSTLRIMGIASGLDTESIIQNSLKIHQLKIDQQMKNRTQLLWKQQSLNSIKDDITNFRRSFLTALGSNAMRSSAVYNTTKAVVSGKNASAVSVLTPTGAATGSIEIRSISLAKGASVSSSSRITAASSLSTKLSALGMSDPVTIYNETAKKFSFDVAEAEGNAILKAANAAGGVTYSGGTVIYQVDGVDKGYYIGGYDAQTPENKAKAMAFLNETFALTGTLNEITDLDNYDSIFEKLEDAGVQAYKDDTVVVKEREVETSPGSFTTLAPVSFTLKSLSDAGQRDDLMDVFELDPAKVRKDALKEAIKNAGGEIDEYGIATLYDTSLGGDITFDFNGLDYDSISGLSTSLGSAGITLDANGKVSFNTVDKTTKTINITEGMTIGDLIKAVNGSGKSVTLSFDSLSQRFTLESNNIGSDASTLSVTGFGQLGIADGAATTNGTHGSAVLYINGKREEFSTEDGTMTGNVIELGGGVKITLNRAITEDDDPINIEIKRDASDALAKIKTFIDAYNTLIQRLETLLKERKTGDEVTYKPLTDEEKAGLSEKQIADWEAIAKKGLLYNDSGIRSLTSALRSALYEQIDAAGLSPSQIGIVTGPYSVNNSTGGQIVLDEDRLRAALEEDPEKVMNVFMAPKTTENPGGGWTYRIDDIMNNYVSNSQFYSLATLENSIKRYNERVESLQAKMYKEEERLYAKYSALETALSKLQSQGDYFASMLGGGGK
jgi:flagellar hook-associated protein 2